MVTIENVRQLMLDYMRDNISGLDVDQLVTCKKVFLLFDELQNDHNKAKPVNRTLSPYRDYNLKPVYEDDFVTSTFGKVGKVKHTNEGAWLVEFEDGDKISLQDFLKASYQGVVIHRQLAEQITDGSVRPSRATD